jgi:putative iron-regulated protein
MVLLVGCDPSRASESKEVLVLRQHVEIIHANYHDVVAGLQALKDAVDGFVANPTSQSHEAAKQAWHDVRFVYGQSEVTRFYGGPIDKDGLEDRANAWPIDEAFIDYTIADPKSGIINQPAEVPKITPSVLGYYNGQAGQENRALGFHAVEFLLWGQRPDPNGGPGERPYTDYVDGGTASNQERRRTYLQTATSMLLTDLSQVLADWDLDDPKSYASGLVAGNPHVGLDKILRGMANMAVAELLYERLYDPYVTRDPKDEESCFSESTWDDVVSNALGVENVYLGRYQELTGPSISDLVKAKDAGLDARTREQLASARTATEAIPKPFDHAVLEPDESPGRVQVKAAIDAWTMVSDTFQEVSKALGNTLNYTSR